ncbi:hypothetical protein T459_00003 [Capsicum annuum]|uniref:Uncharacterized protein n=2 Tax=Capsicum annuum TaxID=4072 RepID=A0A2G3AD17_CAPAN|nr:hypothetical protein T459_00003 [Capsicum annuum]
MGLRQTIDGRIIKKEPVYGGNSPFAFGPHGSYLESRSAMGDASVSSFSSVESNTQPFNEPLLDADTTSFGFLVKMPQNFGFSDLTADFTNSSEMMKNNFFFFRSSTNDANKTPSPPLKSKEVSSWRSVSLSSGSFYDSGSGKKNFTDLRKSPHGHSKKVHPKKSGHDLSRDLSAPVLIRTIRILTKEKVQIASEVSSMPRNQVVEWASAKEEASILQAELDSRTRRLETKKNELQSILKKELDRRSSDWSLKLEKYQIEQHRLRERASRAECLSTKGNLFI